MTFAKLNNFIETNTYIISFSYPQGISVVISSPFLRCLQTAQESCRALNLSGIIIDNSVSEVLSPGSKMKAPPEVPLQDLSPYSISIVQHDSNPLPPFPETSQQAIARYVADIVQNIHIVQ